MKSKWPSVIVAPALICLAVGLIVGAYFGLEYIRTLAREQHFQRKRDGIAALQRQYPFESIVSRLDYETESSERLTSEVRLSPRSAQFLRENDEKPRSLRTESLYHLHTEMSETFMDTFGMGQTRTPRPGAHLLELANVDPVDFDRPIALSESAEPQPELPLSKEDATEGMNAWRAPSEQYFASYHDHNIRWFASDDATGFVRDRDHVAGFVSHSLYGVPKLDGYSWEHRFKKYDRSAPELTAKDIRYDKWAMTRLELVSLLKHDTPKVYVAEHLPNMEELRDAETRELNDFERQSLAGLRDGEDVIVQATLNRIHLFGSLRAGKKCLQCHTAQYGELLGAFSYDLQRDEPLIDPPSN